MNKLPQRGRITILIAGNGSHPEIVSLRRRLMITEQQKRDLAELYQGEVAGEAFYCTLLRQFRAPYQQYLLGSLLQLETETKARLRPIVFEHGIDLVEIDDCRREGEELVSGTEHMGWIEASKNLAKLIESFVPRFRAIAGAAPPEWKALADSMVEHEILIQTATELAASGEDKRAVELVASQLVFPLPEPS